MRASPLIRRRGTVVSPVVVLLILLSAGPAVAQEEIPFSIPDVLSPAFPYDLVAARSADRIAWLAYERGGRNVYTAAGPEYRPVRLTGWWEDDGRDLSALQVSADGSVLLFVRGHTPDRTGWIANPASDPR
nr:hypothetical protein [Gemmatimonadota bacterium]NIQ54958.1 hypothetical protein [Gemmatimonadota bacterium]NIU75157.1 hypothetical protein [Gammaproteobacteria bacterium]NIX44980.1 hypothetical protein [Gemmatimonadota bacterium]NIY09210.1 hypothetical protein [Gemmatimonadota bacterium]